MKGLNQGTSRLCCKPMLHTCARVRGQVSFLILIMRINYIVSIALFFFISNVSAGQESAHRFRCPMKNGRIIIETDLYTHGKQDSSAVIIKGKAGKVYASSDGLVNYVDSAYGLGKLSIQYGSYNFLYSYIEIPKVLEGQKVTKGDLIGIVKNKDQLLLRIMQEHTPVKPETIFGCKVVYRYFER
jgi:hypothetical protein